MKQVIGFKEKDTRRLLFCETGDLILHIGDQCIINTGYGLDVATVSTYPCEQQKGIEPTANVEVLRKLTEEDHSQIAINAEKERRAFRICKERIRERKLPMKLVSVKYMFDGKKALFFYTADGRVDFRELVRDLAFQFKCRIEMKQIGVRDEAKMIGGVGICGCSLCCMSFLKDFEPVSIRMAKEQGLTLIPSKISGLCGRLLCCLMYEYENYLKVHGRVPRVGRRVETPRGIGKIKEINVPLEKLVIELETGERFDIPICFDENIPIRECPRNVKPGAQRDKKNKPGEAQNGSETEIQPEVQCAEERSKERPDTPKTPDHKQPGRQRSRKIKDSRLSAGRSSSRSDRPSAAHPTTPNKSPCSTDRITSRPANKKGTRSASKRRLRADNTPTDRSGIPELRNRHHAPRRPRSQKNDDQTNRNRGEGGNRSRRSTRRPR